MEAERAYSVRPASSSESHLGSSSQVVQPNVPQSASSISEVAEPHPTSSAEYLVSEIKRHKKVAGLIAVAALILASVSLFAYFHLHQAHALTDKDTILLADFVNTTGDAVFDGTLRQALTVQLGQSPFLNIFPDTGVREALRYMNRSPDERVTKDVAQEICQRHGLKALLTGSISNLGSHYVITLEALNGQTGEGIAREQAEAESKEQVLHALGTVAVQMREKLGESLSSIQRFDAPVEQATTSSLEALKAFSMGNELRNSGKELQATPFYKRAIELDPNFALGYVRLAVIYSNIGQPELAAEYMQKAFDLRDRVSEREKLYISSWYYAAVTGEIDKEIEALELYQQTYPRDRIPPNNLSVDYRYTGQSEKAMEEARESIRLDPNSADGYANLSWAFVQLNRFDEAKEVLDRALAHKLDLNRFHEALYWIGFIHHDAALMKQQMDWASGNPYEHDALDWQAQTAAFSGQLTKSREFTRRAIELAERRDLKEVAAVYAAGNGEWEAVTGNCQQTRQDVSTTFALARSRISQFAGAVGLALCGEVRQAQSISDNLARQYPKDTLVNAFLVPTIE